MIAAFSAVDAMSVLPLDATTAENAPSTVARCPDSDNPAATMAEHIAPTPWIPPAPAAITAQF